MAEEIWELLRSIGFSEDQTQVYLNLLNKGERQSIERAIVEPFLPSNRAEDAIGVLVDRGMLRVARNELVVVSPAESLSLILEEKRRQKGFELAHVEKTVAEIQKRLEPIYWEKSAGVRSESIIDPLLDLAAMEMQTAKTIANARESIAIFAETFGWYRKVKEELLRALDRRVRTRVLMTATDEISAGLSMELKEHGVEVRLASPEWYPIRGTLGDESALVFLIWATKKDEPKPIHHFPYSTRSVGLIKIFSDAFKQRWQEAQPLDYQHALVFNKQKSKIR